MNVSEKIVLQAKSAARALKEIAKADCFVAGGVYLPNAAQEDIPYLPDIIGASFRVSNFVEFLAKSRAATTRDGVTRLRQKTEIEPVVDSLREALRPVVLSELNRKRVQRITPNDTHAISNSIKPWETSSLSFRGKRGRGRLPSLVRLANDLCAAGKAVSLPHVQPRAEDRTADTYPPKRLSTDYAAHAWALEAEPSLASKSKVLISSFRTPSSKSALSESIYSAPV